MRGSDSRQVGTTHGAGGHNVFQWPVFIAWEFTMTLIGLLSLEGDYVITVFFWS